MRIWLVGAVVALVAASAAVAGTMRVSGYTTKSGTYVAPHRATMPDSRRTNNWSAKGNVNPYTGVKGTKDPFKAKAPR